jgi:hypothetical protein
VLWRQPISDRDDQTGHGIAEAAANAIGGIKSSKGPSSTEEVDEHGERPLAFRLIETKRNVPCWPWNRTVDNLSDRLGSARPGANRGKIGLTSLLHGEGVERGNFLPLSLETQRLDLWIKWHETLLKEN